jgi:hypothetical protein
MALTQASLANKIKSELQAYFSTLDASWLDQFAQALAKAVVDEIKSNAVVTVNGVQSGGSTANGTIS